MLVACLIFLLLPFQIQAETISSEDLKRLEEILSELENKSQVLQTQLSEALTQVKESKDSLEKVKTSFAEYEKESQGVYRKVYNEKELWKVSTIVTGVLAILGIGAILALR